MKRCVTCRGVIWPWQHYGFRVREGLVVDYWHARRCIPVLQSVDTIEQEERSLS